jgi:hypothetical protein
MVDKTVANPAAEEGQAGAQLNTTECNGASAEDAQVSA